MGKAKNIFFLNSSNSVNTWRWVVDSYEGVRIAIRIREMQLVTNRVSMQMKRSMLGILKQSPHFF